MKRRKSQAALEYMATFGIAVIIAITIGVVLHQLGIFQAPKQKVYLGLEDFTILDWKVAGDNFVITLAPRKDVIIYGINVSDSANGNWSGRIVASADEKVTFNIKLDRTLPENYFYNLVVTINYTDLSSGLEHLAFGTFRGYVEVSLEEEKTWYFSGWAYRRPIYINGTNETLTDYQVPLNISYEEGMSPDFSDLRFTYVGSEIEIPYYIEKKVDEEWAYVWVKVPKIPANGQAKLYLYWGNPNATSKSNANNVFEPTQFVLNFSSEQGIESYENTEISNGELRLANTTQLSWNFTNLWTRPKRIWTGTTGDVDGDGVDEIIFITESCLWIVDEDSGTTSSIWCPDVALRCFDMTAGDIDSDGKDEVFFGGGAQTNYSLYMAEMLENGSWAINVIGKKADVMGLDVGDTDNDGTLELAVVYYGSQNTTFLYEYNSGTWINQSIPPYWGDTQDVAIGDSDNDGTNEIIVIGKDPNGFERLIKVYYDSGNWTYYVLPISEVGHKVLIGDADKDGVNSVFVLKVKSNVSEKIVKQCVIEDQWNGSQWTTREIGCIQFNNTLQSTSLPTGFCMANVDNDSEDEFYYTPLNGTSGNKILVELKLDGSCKKIADYNTPYAPTFVVGGDGDADGLEEIYFSGTTQTGQYALVKGEQVLTQGSTGYVLTIPIPSGNYRWGVGKSLNATQEVNENGSITYTFFYYNGTDWVEFPEGFLGTQPPINLSKITPSYNLIKVRIELNTTKANYTPQVDQVTINFLKRKYHENVSATLGPTESQVQLTIFNPEAKTYSSLNPIQVPIEFKVNGTFDTYNVIAMLDGNIIYQNNEFPNNSTYSTTKTFYVSGDHNLTVIASQGNITVKKTVLFSIATCDSSQTWWNESFSKRRKICINSSEETDGYQLLLNISYDGDMQSDFDDLRFTYFDGIDEVEIPYYIEDTSANYSLVWIKVPYLSSTRYTTIYMYYGNPDATRQSNASQVFDFYDGFETWSGWVKYGNGVVSQSTDYVRKGDYSLKKDQYADPNGAYKELGFTLDYPFVLEAWIYRSYLSGSNADRIGVIDASGNGYGPHINHPSGNDELKIDKRSGYSATYLGKIYIDARLVNQWYFVRFIWNDGNMEVKYFDADGNLKGSTSATDTSYSSFTRVYVFGGYTYYVDELRIRKYLPTEPNYTILEEEEYSKIKLDVFEPEANYSATCAWNITIPFNFTVYGPYDEYNVSVTFDGVEIYSQTVANNSNIYFTHTVNASKTYEVIITASSGDDIKAKRMWVDVDITTPFVDIVVYSPQNKTYMGWPNVTVWINFTLEGCYDSYNTSVFLDGAPIFQDVVANATNVSIERVFDTNGTHHLVINATNEISNESEIYFTTSISNISWYYTGWSYRRPVYVHNNADQTVLNYQLMLQVNYSTNMQSDFDDVRFTLLNETTQEETPLSYWKEYAGDFAIFWVKIPELPANGNVTLYMYYGNPSASDESNASQVFDFYDGIEDGIDEWEDLSTGTCYIVFNQTNETKTHDNYSIRVWMWKGDNWQSGQGWNPIMRRNVTVDEDHGFILWFNYSQFGGHLEGLTFRDANGYKIVGISLRYYHDPDDTTHINGVDIGKVWPMKEWGRILVKDINPSAKTVDVAMYYANLTPYYIGDDMSFDSTSAVPPITQFKITASTYWMNQPAIYYFDSLAVFKYVEPEPTYTFGEEESA